MASLTFPAGEVGIGYPTVSLVASGGTPPYTWSIGAGALPGGLALSTSSISGTPTAVGPFQFTVNVTDSAGVTAGAAQSMTVVPYVTFSGNCTNVCSVEQGCVTVCGAYAMLGGGLAPFQYQLSGTLPPGTTLNGPSLAGTFTTVSAAAPFSFAVMVTDALGATGAAKANYSVFAQISLQGGTCSTKVLSGFGCTARLPYAGGTGKPASAAISAQTPVPKGTTVTIQGGLVLFSVPAQTVPVNVKAVVILTDSAVCGPNAGQQCVATSTVIISIN
jgi:large repetitive protein